MQQQQWSRHQSLVSLRLPCLQYKLHIILQPQAQQLLQNLLGIQ